VRARAPDEPLATLAARRGVAVSYEDASHRLRTVSPETLVAVLAALGEPIERPADAADCLARPAAAAEAVGPVVVAWDGQLPAAAVERLAEVARARSDRLRLELEDGSETLEVPSARAAGTPVRQALPFGAHTLRAGEAATLVISAPSRPRALAPRAWGLFAPTYALWDERRRPTGDLRCLARLGGFAASLGASYLATLPLLADYSSLDDPGAVVSPYSPLSRMWWNEAYLDLARLAGSAAEAGETVPSAPPGGLADIAASAAAVDEALARLLATAHPGEGGRSSDYGRFRRERPDVVRYAAFRAAARARGTDRSTWPARWLAGDIRSGRDVSPAEVELHMCAQWLTDDQLADVAASTAAAGCRLLLDLPVGCRPDGYDTWAFPSSFAGGAAPGPGATVGAPPDGFFAGGQDWGFRPLHPEGERRAGYPVVRGALRHLLRHAGALRIDHILSFQRLWWIPPGADASEGTYVSYPAEEMVALACLEAWRRDASLIGEDLGTVDPAVRLLMSAHGIAGMRVAVFELEADPAAPLLPNPGSCALVDTHDTATFAGFLDGTDIEQRLSAGLLDAASARRERRRRRKLRRALVDRLGGVADDPRALHAAVLAELGSSEAGVVIATLEDLWAEHDPQNIPGGGGAHADFARRTAEPLEVIERDAEVIGPLRRLDQARHAGAPAAGAAPYLEASPGDPAATACAGASEGMVEA